MKTTDVLVAVSMAVVFIVGRLAIEQCDERQLAELSLQHPQIAVGACGTGGVKQGNPCPGLASRGCDTTIDEEGNRLGCTHGSSHGGCPTEAGNVDSGTNENITVTTLSDACGRVTGFLCEVVPVQVGERTQYDCHETTNAVPEKDAILCPGEKKVTAAC